MIIEYILFLLVFFTVLLFEIRPLNKIIEIKLFTLKYILNIIINFNNYALNLKFIKNKNIKNHTKLLNTQNR